MSLYSFENGHRFLDRLGVRRLESYENNVVIERREFAEQEANGEIEYRKDGVYLLVDGEYRRGFLYNKDYKVDEYGMPKFHVTDCTMLQERFIARGILNRYYYWSNAPKVQVTQRRGTEVYQDQVLNLCSQCAQQIVEETFTRQSTTESAFAAAVFNDIPTSETDMFGRPLNWNRISINYRMRMNYTCEKCGFGGDDLRRTGDRKYIDADHIIAHELTNTSDSNLQCLCALCHAMKDKIHTKHLLRPHVIDRVVSFVDDYRAIIAQKNLDTLEKFETQFRN